MRNHWNTNSKEFFIKEKDIVEKLERKWMINKRVEDTKTEGEEGRTIEK